MRKEKYIDLYLNLIIPFAYIYIAGLIIKSIVNTGLKNQFLEMIVITILSAVVLYGVLSIIKDLKEFGTLHTLKYWWNKLTK